jgi:SAM-dependent methyltransferase
MTTLEMLNVAKSLEIGLCDRCEDITRPSQEAVVRRVAAAYRAAKRDEIIVSAEYRVAGEWESYWKDRGHLYRSLLADDIDTASALLQNFWRNELGPIVKEYARFDQLLEDQPGARERFEREVRRNLGIWKEMIRGEIGDLRIPVVGNPWGLWIDNELIAPKATRFHALAHQVVELIRGNRHPVVLEVGGGYGGFAFYLLRDCPSVTYIDLDLPETLALASYYLLMTHPDRDILLYGESSNDPPRGWADYSAVLLPNYVFPTIDDGIADVVVNTFSLSEVVWPTLVEYVRQIERVCRGYFLHHNMDRTGVINRGSERIPASRFPIRPEAFRLLYKHFDLFHGSAGDYRDFLYQRLTTTEETT